MQSYKRVHQQGKLHQNDEKHSQDEVHPNDELLDLVDENDCVVQTLPRSQVYAQNLCAQMRSVWLMIKNNQGQLWIPRRSWNAKRLPGHLDGSAVGHVQAGESYQQALIRETQEEVGIILQPDSYTYLGKLTPQQHKVFSFSAVYELVVEQAPQNWNRNDIAQWYWMTPEEFLQRCDQGEKYKDSLPILIKNFYMP